MFLIPDVVPIFYGDFLGLVRPDAFCLGLCVELVSI